MELNKKTGIRKWIIALSIIIPLAVAILFGVKIPGIDLGFLPSIYAAINGATAVLLVLALVAIKNGKKTQHENIIKACMILSVLFLLLYVAYHMTSDSTIYGDIDGDGKRSIEEAAALGGKLLVYQIILLSHIVLSVVIIPFVLFTYLHAWEGNFEKHKKLAKIAWPMWFYVAVTGVVVYFMISPFYQ